MSNLNLYLGESIKGLIRKNNYLIYTQKNIYFANNVIDTRPKKNIYLKDPFFFNHF